MKQRVDLIQSATAKSGGIYLYELQICLGLEECKFVMLVWHDS